MCSDVAGYVLAGGRSSRMGQDKAMLGIDGVPLIQRAVRLLQGVCASVAILSGPPVDDDREQVLRRYAPTLPDAAREYQGPLAGVAAALEQCRAECAVFIAVDQVGLTASLLVQLLEAMQEGRAEPGSACVFSGPDGTPEPLPLLVARAVAPLIREELATGERRLLVGVQQAVQRSNGRLNLLPQLHTSEAIGVNLNTPADLDRWRNTLAVATNPSALRASE